MARKVGARQVVLKRVGAQEVFFIGLLGALIGMRPMVRKESVLQVLTERYARLWPGAKRKPGAGLSAWLCLPGLNERLDARDYGKNTR